VTAYRGRFAPSPTGPLHFGSLVAALGSYLDARAHGGQWLVRMEDLDPPREMPGAADAILKALEAHGLHWDGTVLRQSTRSAAYEAALAQLRRAGLLYPCCCTRKEIADSMLSFAVHADRGEMPLHDVLGDLGASRAMVYAGTCRNGLPSGRAPRAERVRVGQANIEFTDALQGPIRQSLADEVGDFVLRRADGLIAYQLAVVVDDAAQGITDVVRGADLLDSTARQIFLQRALGLPTPRHLHLPVAINALGEKLSKQTLAAPLANTTACRSLFAALEFLGHAPPAQSGRWAVDELLGWAVAAWDRTRLPRMRARPARA
jgi:glutamyl-Q tRNA(Asp) synthetase